MATTLLDAALPYLKVLGLSTQEAEAGLAYSEFRTAKAMQKNQTKTNKKYLGWEGSSR